MHTAQSLASGLSRIDDLNTSVSSRISSGRRLDRPAADPAGLGQASRLDSEQARLRSAEVNIQNGVSRLQVTTGHLGQMSKVVTRLSELATYATNAAASPSDRAQYGVEFRQLQDQLRQTIGGSPAEIGGTNGVDRPLANFEEAPLFGPGAGESLVIGADPAERLALPALNLREDALGALIRQDSAGAFTLTLGGGDDAALGQTLRSALDQLAEGQAEVGAGQSRLGLAASLAATVRANQEAALSGIQDADIAAESTQLARLQILQEGHTAMLVQAREMSAKLLPLLSRG